MALQHPLNRVDHTARGSQRRGHGPRAEERVAELRLLLLGRGHALESLIVRGKRDGSVCHLLPELGNNGDVLLAVTPREVLLANRVKLG